MQDAETGREANEEGKLIAWSVADALGARLTEPDKSNRCDYQGRAAVIKSAQRGTRRIEITKRMFSELELVLLAVETLPSHFDVYEVSRQSLDDRRLSSTGWKSRETQWAFDIKALTMGLRAAHRVRHIEYRIELYWPWAREERKYKDDYALWVHDGKVERVWKIPTGSQILFYETEHDYKGEGDGAKTIFAAGTLTDYPPESYDSFQDDQGRYWREARLVAVDRWVKPAQGIPLKNIRAILGKSPDWKMRSGPYPIRPEQFRALAEQLSKVGGRVNEVIDLSSTSSSPFRCVSQKDEEDSIRLQAADEIRIRKVHNQLVNQFASYCRNVLALEPEEETFDLLLRLPDSKSVLLIEAKSAYTGGVGQYQARQAIGQLFDYRFTYWGQAASNVKLAVLFPDKPAEQIAALLDALGIGTIWRRGESFVATEHVRSAHGVLQKLERAD